VDAHRGRGGDDRDTVLLRLASGDGVALGLIMIGIADCLTSDHMRAAFRDPAASTAADGSAT
jgi:hypothetical protein